MSREDSEFNADEDTSSGRHFDLHSDQQHQSRSTINEDANPVSHEVSEINAVEVSNSRRLSDLQDFQQQQRRQIINQDANPVSDEVSEINAGEVSDSRRHSDLYDFQQQHRRLTINQDANPVSHEVSEFNAGEVSNYRRHSDLYDFQQQQRRLTLNQDSNPMFCEVSELRKSLNKESFQHFTGRSKKLQNLQPQRLQQLGRDQRMTRDSQSGISFNKNFESQATMKIIPNKLIVHQSSQSQIQQPLKELGIKRLHPQSQNLTQSNPNKFQLTSEQFQQHRADFNQGRPSTSQASNLLPESSSGIGFVTNPNQNTMPEGHPSINYAVVKELQFPYSNRSDIVNILIYGPVDWTNRLLQTYTRGLPMNFVEPFKLVHETNVTRCGVFMSVAIWQTNDLTKSTDLLKSLCLTSRSTLMLVFNFEENFELFATLAPLVGLARERINRCIPIVLVGCKVSTGIPGNPQDDTLSRRVREMGNRVKTRLNLSGFLNCSVDLVSDVDNVFLTAIDVSHLLLT